MAKFYSTSNDPLMTQSDRQMDPAVDAQKKADTAKKESDNSFGIAKTFNEPHAKFEQSNADYEKDKQRKSAERTKKKTKMQKMYPTNDKEDK